MILKPPLKIAIAVGDGRVPRWQAALVNEAAHIAGVELTVIRLRSARRRPSIAPSARRLDRVDYLVTRRLTSVQDPLVDAFIDLPIQTANFRKDYFDLVINLSGPFRSARALMPHRGVWSLVFGKYFCAHDHHPCIEEVLAADEVTSTFLIERKATADGATLLAKAHIAVDPNSIFVTRAQALWAAPQLVSSALRQLVNGSLAATPALPEFERRKARPHLSVSGERVFDYVISGLTHAWCSLFRRDEWQLHYRNGKNADYKGKDLADFTLLPRLKNSFLADPFVIEHEGRLVIFCEEYLFGTKRGIISCVEIKDGKPQGSPVRVLEKPYHLSYPFLIRQGGDLFMIPETSANNSVDLYRCTRFPDAWVHEATLLSDIKAVDTTIAAIDGKLWMFTGVKRPETRNFDELHLYSADSLTGPWLPHPANPVRFDVRSSRPAGALFRDGDNWIRPAQDGSLRYGRRIMFQRVTALTESSYAEETAGVFDPKGEASVEGVHTWNFSDGMGVIDSVRQVSKSGMKKS